MTSQVGTPDFTIVKQRQQATWASGNYPLIANVITITSELLCEAVDLRARQRVLDVATGTGNTALAAARRHCNVTGIDYAPTLLERGRERAAVERLPVTFQEGDAEALPFPDASFDVVLSTFGVMFTPDQERAAAELARVCRPGGRIGLANWTPEGFIGDLFRTTGRYVPPPPGVKPAVLWGSEDWLQDAFAGRVSSIQTTRRIAALRFHSTDHWLDFFRTNYGPTLKAFEALDASGQAALAKELTEAVARYNVSGDDTIVLPQEYLEAVLVRE